MARRPGLLSLSTLSAGCLALAWTTSAPSPASADESENDTDVIHVPDIMVEAPRPDGVPQERVTGADTTVTAEDIEDQQIRRLDTALELVPGLNLGGRRGAHPRPIGIRSLGPRNTRVFIDGIEVSDTSLAQSQFQTDGQTMMDIDRIEVLRGARPGRFGADNAGGVINITTKPATGPLSGQLRTEYGGYDTKRVSGTVSGAQGPVDLRLSAGGTHTEGFSDYNKTRGGREDDPSWSASIGGRLGIQATDDLRFDVVGHYLREHIQWDYSTGDTDGIDNYTKRYVRGAATLEMLDDTLIHTLGLADTLSTRDFNGAGRGNDSYDGGKTRLDYVGTWAVREGVSLEFGADATRERIKINAPSQMRAVSRTEEDMWQGGAFLSLGLTPLEGLDLSASGRVDEHEEFGSEFTYRLGAAYTIEQTGTTVRGSYATAWQTPSLYERYDPCYGNTDLDPESSQGWDVGVDQRLWAERLVGHVTYFQNNTEDQIDWATSAGQKPGCPFAGGYVNVNEAFTQGVEVAVSAHPLDTVDVSFGYTWQNAINDETKKRLENVPINQATASVTWRFLPEAMVNVGVRYRDRITRFGGEADAFWTADVRLAYDVLENVTVHGRVENLFDADYEETPGYGTAGRAVYGGVTVRF